MGDDECRGGRRGRTRGSCVLRDPTVRRRDRPAGGHRRTWTLLGPKTRPPLDPGLEWDRTAGRVIGSKPRTPYHPLVPVPPCHVPRIVPRSSWSRGGERGLGGGPSSPSKCHNRRVTCGECRGVEEGEGFSLRVRVPRRPYGDYPWTNGGRLKEREEEPGSP